MEEAGEASVNAFSDVSWPGVVLHVTEQRPTSQEIRHSSAPGAARRSDIPTDELEA